MKKRRPTINPTTIGWQKSHEQHHDDYDIPDNPEPDFYNHYVEDSYPMQGSDIEELIDLHVHFSAKMAFSYHITKHSASSLGSLVDRGAYGGLAATDAHVLEQTGRKVSVTGTDDQELPGLDIVTCVAPSKPTMAWST